MLEAGSASVVDVALLGLDAPIKTDRRQQSQRVDGLRALVHRHEPGRKVQHRAAACPGMNC